MSYDGERFSSGEVDRGLNEPTSEVLFSNIDDILFLIAYRDHIVTIDISD